MQSTIGNLNFDTGWKTKISIVFFGEAYPITVKACAYRETDGITEAQRSAFSDFVTQKAERQTEIEQMLISAFGTETARTRFQPRRLLFQRDGEYALLCDDADEPDDGIAIILQPDKRIASQDEYL